MLRCALLHSPALCCAELLHALGYHLRCPALRCTVYYLYCAALWCATLYCAGHYLRYIERCFAATRYCLRFSTTCTVLRYYLRCAVTSNMLRCATACTVLCCPKQYCATLLLPLLSAALRYAVLQSAL